jgi:hypothetical protein
MTTIAEMRELREVLAFRRCDDVALVVRERDADAREVDLRLAAVLPALAEALFCVRAAAIRRVRNRWCDKASDIRRRNDPPCGDDTTECPALEPYISS